MEFMYIMTENNRKCPNASKCRLRKGTESKNTSSYILLDYFNAFGLSRNNFFCRKQRENGGILNSPPSEPPGQFDWTKLAHCTSRPCILQNKTIIRPLRHNVLRIFLSPLVGPQGVQTGPKLHMRN